MVWARSYGRKSRALGDPDDPAVVAHQLDACDRAALQRGIELDADHRIAEVGSGESIDGRPRFAELLANLERRPPGDGFLFVSEIARLSRADMEEIGRVMRILRSAGVKVVAGSRVFDLSDPNDELYFTFLAANARHEVRNYALRVAVKMDQLTRSGELTTGSAPFGYRWIKGRGRDRGRLEPIPEEFSVVQGLFKDAVHFSIERLSQKYGIPRPTVNYILRNPVYTGWPHRHTAWKKSASGVSSSRMLPENQWGLRAEQPGNYPAAVTVEQFYVAREALQRRWRERAKTGDADGWCRRLLVLEGWEGARVQLGSFDHDGTPSYYFVHPTTGSRRAYAREPIHALASQKIVALLSNPQLIRQALAQAEANQPVQSERDQLRQTLGQLREQLVRLKLEAASDTEDRLALETAQERVRSRIKTVQKQLSQSVHPQGAGQPMRAIEALLNEIEDAALEVWEEAPPTEKAELAEALLRTILVRIDCPGRRQPCQREILGIEYAPWLRSFIQSVECNK